MIYDMVLFILYRLCGDSMEKKKRRKKYKKDIFIEEYAKEKINLAMQGKNTDAINNTEIARRAGYSDKGEACTVRAVEVVHSSDFDNKVAEYVNKELKALENVPIMTREDILKRLGQIASGCAVTGQDAPPSYENQLSALDKINKIHGLYSEKIEYSGAVPVILKDDLE